MKRFLALTVLAFAWTCQSPAQVIEYESNGLKYQTLTRSGVTVIFTQLPNHVHAYSVVQVSVSNGSAGPYVIRPEDFSYVRSETASVRALPSRTVVSVLYQKASGHDVIRLVTTYEASVYGGHLNTTNGFETRRQAAMTVMTSAKLKAAATASAIALVQTKLLPGESTDGAVFFPTDGKPLGPGRLVVRTNTDVFEFLPTSD
jgi:hypothetical protein